MCSSALPPMTGSKMHVPTEILGNHFLRIRDAFVRIGSNGGQPVGSARALSVSLCLSLFLSLSLSLSLYLRFSRVRSAAYNPNDPHDLWPGLAARNDPGCICVIANTDHHLSLPVQVWITAALKHDGCATTWQGIARLI